MQPKMGGIKNDNAVKIVMGFIGAWVNTPTKILCDNCPFIVGLKQIELV